MCSIGHGDGEGNQLRPRLDVSYSNSNVTPPDVDNRRSATIIIGIHALIIFLLKISVQRQDPVGTFLVGATLIRPESRRAHIGLRVYRVPVIGPTFDRELGCSGVSVLDIKERHRGKVVIYGDGDRLFQLSCFSFHREPLTFSEGVFCVLVFLRGQEKCGPGLVSGGYGLRGSERSHHRLLLVKTGNHPAAEVVVKLNADIAALNSNIASANVRGYRERRSRQYIYENKTNSGCRWSAQPSEQFFDRLHDRSFR